MLATSLLKLVGGSMLQQGGLTGSCLSLAASAAQGHRQLGGCMVLRQCCQGVTACHASHMHTRGRLQVAPQHHPLAAAPSSCSPLQRATRVPAVGACHPASPGSFQLPGTHSSSSSTAWRSPQLRQLCTHAPMQPDPKSPVAVTALQSPAGAAMDQAAHRKRTADMDHWERLQCLHEKLYEHYDGWDLEELLSLSPARLDTVFRAMCPECQGGSKQENSFAVTVTADDQGRPAAVLFKCHRATCGFQGGMSVRGYMSEPAAAPRQPSGSFSGMLPPEMQSQQQLQVQRAWQQLQPTQQQQAPQAMPEQALQPSAGFGLAPTLQLQQGPGAPAPQRQLGKELQALSPELLQWLQARGISRATLERNRVGMEVRYCGALKEWREHIAFPYYREGVVVNVKYRALPKYFTQVKGGQQIFYGYDDAKGAEEVIIVEGELDKLAVEEALMQAAAAAAAQPSGQQPDGAAAPHAPDAFMLSPEGGRRAVVSVPAGAPSRVAGPSTGNERKFKFVDDCRDILTAAKRVVLAVDTDGPGLALAAELVRRIGPEKCLTVRWPRKDASEVLQEDGASVVKACLDAAEHVPIRGLFHFDAFRKEVWLLWSQGVKGLGSAFGTGWPSVDKHYRVVPGELTIVTGLSNSGKSEWLDALTVNLAKEHGWRFAMCSLENSIAEHGRKLMEKYCGMAFFDDQNSHDVGKMVFDDVVDGILFVDEHFHLILPPPDEMPSIDYILDKARVAVLRYGIKGLVIDPYNELDTRRGRDMSETEYVSTMLSKIKRFAQHYECHVWFVAHPRTQRGSGVGGGSSSLSAPSMYDISGSAHFINKADNGIVVHRPWTGMWAASEGRDTTQTQILVRKVRNKVAGSIGDVTLSYDRATGRYRDVEA